MENSVEVTNLSKSYGLKEAVKNINFEIKENQIIGLLGPNGCGKTTTIGMLIGLLKPSNGDIIINGAVINGAIINGYDYFQKAAVSENGVLQLAHIAGPIETHEQIQGIGRQAVHRLALGCRQFGDEMFRQGRDIIQAVPQGRDLNGKDVQAVKQILAKFPFADLSLQLAVGGGDQADVHLYRLGGADRVNLALLQGAQQLDLHVLAQLANLVEEKRAAVGFLKFAGVALGGAGEGAFFVAEQHAFDQVFGNGAAVDGDKGFAGPL